MSWLLRKMLSPYMAEEGGAEGGDSTGGSSTTDETKSSEGENKSGDENKSTISDSEAKLLKEVMDKKTALKKAQEELSQKVAQLKKLEDLGGVDALVALAQEKKTAEQKKLEEKGEWDRIKSQMNEEHGKVLTEKEQVIVDAKNENQKLQNLVADLTVGGLFQSSTFVKESLVIPAAHARKIYGSHFEFVNGVVVAHDKPAGSADRTVLVDAKGDPLGFEAAMQKIIDADPDRDSLLKSKVKSGAGSSTTTKTKTANTQVDKPFGQDRISSAIAKGLLDKKA